MLTDENEIDSDEVVDEWLVDLVFFSISGSRDSHRVVVSEVHVYYYVPTPSSPETEDVFDIVSCF